MCIRDRFIDENTDEYISKNASKVLQLIKNDEYIREYFFKKVNSVKWFFPLKEKGYFSPDKAPPPQPAEQEGYFTIPEWYVLPYLEKVSKQVTIKGNEKYAEELLKIIDDVTNYHIKHDRKLDNYRTWWYFVKILLNIPNDMVVKYLKDHNIKIGEDWIKVWITSKFDNVLPASEIATKLLPKFLTQKKEDINIAEQIIDVITAIREDFWEEEAENKKPKTMVDSYWLVESFKKNAQKVGELCSNEVIFNLADKLKSIFDEKYKDSQVLIDLEDSTYRIICLLYTSPSPRD